MSTFKELIYADSTIRKAISQRWPQAKITDARDDVHDERFEVEIEEVDENQFYPFAISSGFLGACFCFRMAVGLARSGEESRKIMDKVEQWKLMAKECGA